jgi:predicted PurR-regulated permease PerM
VSDVRFRRAFLLLLVAAISAAFIAMIRAFLVTILLSAIFAGLSYPLYQWILRRRNGHKATAAIATLVLLLALVMAPLLAVLGAGANEALRVSRLSARSPAVGRSARRIRRWLRRRPRLPAHRAVPGPDSHQGR